MQSAAAKAALRLAAQLTKDIQQERRRRIREYIGALERELEAACLAYIDAGGNARACEKCARAYVE